MTEPRQVAEVFHPSEFIQDECDVRGWSLWDLAARMGKDVAFEKLALDFYFLQDPGIRLGKDGAEGLARAFDVSPEFFLNLEKAWLAHQPSEPGTARCPQCKEQRNDNQPFVCTLKGCPYL